MAPHCFQNSVQIPLSSTADCDTNTPFQISPNTLSKDKTQGSPPQHHDAWSLPSVPIWNSQPAHLQTATPYLVCTSWINSNRLHGAAYDPPGRSVALLWLLMLCPWAFVLLSWCMLHAQNVFSSLLNCNLLNNYIHQLFNFLHPKACFIFSRHSKKICYEWTNERILEKNPHFWYGALKMKVF